MFLDVMYKILSTCVLFCIMKLLLQLLILRFNSFEFFMVDSLSNQYLSAAILADEMGLGKTVQVWWLDN